MGTSNVQHEPYVNPDRAAEFLGVTAGQLFRWAKEGHIKAYKLYRDRREYRFKLSELAIPKMDEDTPNIFVVHDTAARGGDKYCPGYVYVMESQGFHKIGITYDVNKRLIGIRCSIPFDVTVVASVKVWCMGVAERSIHRHFRDKRVRGEWFKLDAEDVSSLMFILERLSKIKSSPANASQWEFPIQ